MNFGHVECYPRSRAWGDGIQRSSTTWTEPRELSPKWMRIWHKWSCGLPGHCRKLCWPFGLLPRLTWSSTDYEVAITHVEVMKRQISGMCRKSNISGTLCLFEQARVTRDFTQRGIQGHQGQGTTNIAWLNTPHDQQCFPRSPIRQIVTGSSSSGGGDFKSQTTRKLLGQHKQGGRSYVAKNMCGSQGPNAKPRESC